MFLMTDNQIVKEQFLVYVNDLLSTGVVSDLFTQARGAGGERSGRGSHGGGCARRCAEPSSFVEAAP